MPMQTGGDADVLANRFGLVGAGGLSGVRALLGTGKLGSASVGGEETVEDDEYGFRKEDFGHDRAGVGMSQSKDGGDGVFTKHMASSESKLLEQMIGKKRAKAHYAAQQKQPERTQTKAQKYAKPRPATEESDDEDEGRAAAFGSKRQKVEGSKIVDAQHDAGDDADGAKADVALAKTEASKDTSDEATQLEEKPKSEPRINRRKAKPTSFLDELLADRSKKKSKKNKTAAS